MASNLSPIQILMLGLAGYGGYRQGKQQRADYLGEQEAAKAKLEMEKGWKERALAIDELLAGPQAKLYEAQANKYAADAGSAGAVNAATPGLLGAIAPGGTQQEITQRVYQWMQANPGAPLPPEFMEAVIGAAYRPRQTTGANFQVDPFSGQQYNYGPTNSDQAALMRETRLGAEASPTAEMPKFEKIGDVIAAEKRAHERWGELTDSEKAKYPGGEDEYTARYAKSLLSLMSGQPQTYESATLKRLGQDPIVILNPGETPEQAETRIINKMLGNAATQLPDPYQRMMGAR